ncbi:hypothetical protein ACF3NG_05335 [Aerococcaceae bacterium WGS1372]
MKFKEMIIDLTPLLDVILILLFMLIASTSQASTDQITELEQKIETLEATQIPATDSERAWYQSYQQSIGKLNIVFNSSLDQDPMYLVLGNGNRVQKEETQDIKSWLNSYVNQLEEEVVILAFTYNNEEIYLRDYRNIISAITQIDHESNKTVVYQEQIINE